LAEVHYTQEKVMEQRGMDHKGEEEQEEEEVAVMVVETKSYKGTFRNGKEPTFAHKNLEDSTFVPNVRAAHADT
jgi:hypothetical protein